MSAVEVDLPPTPWDRSMLSGELQRLIAEIVPSADPVDSADFNPVDYINSMFPNEQSLVDIDTAVAKVRSKIQRVDEEILREVRTQSRHGNQAKTELTSAQLSISDLFNKIRDIKGKAEQSERMVTEICRDIKSLDHAKSHLTASITTLRRLQMLVNAVDQLRSRVNTRQYKEVGNLLEAVNQLSPGFAEFKTISKIQELNSEVALIKGDLGKQIYDEFNRYESQLQMGSGGGGAPLLRDVCFVIDALGEVTKTGFVTWFVEGQLRDYKQAFQRGSEPARLDAIDRRYAWLKREFRYYDDTYLNVFPDTWKMQSNIATEFCIATRLSLSELLETTKNSLDIVALVGAVKKTIEFEKELCTKFQEKERPIIHDDDDEDEYDDAPEDSPNPDEEEDGAQSPYSAAAIRRKWEKHKEYRDKEKRVKMAKVQRANPPAALQFKGMISSCFDPYMDLYIEQEDRNMKEMLERMIAEETWAVPEHESNKVLSSSTDLIYYFNEARKRCGSLTKGQPFYELFLLFKKYLTAYANVLSAKIGEDVPVNAALKPLSDQDEHTVCLIVNTADYCSKTTAQMTETVQRLIDERFKDKIELNNEAEIFSVVTSKGLKALANSLEAKLEPALQSMAKGKWDALEGVGEQSGYISQIDAIIKSTVPVYKDFFSPAHFQYICDSFINSFVSRGIIQNLYKCRRISEVGAQQLLLDFATLKSTLLQIDSRNPPPARYVKMVNKEIGRAEALLKLIITPNEVLVDTYRTLMPTGSETDLNRILVLKGTKTDERNQIVRQYAALPQPTPANAPLSSTPPLAAITSPPISGLAAFASKQKMATSFKKYIPDSLLTLNNK